MTEVTVILKNGHSYKAPESALDNIYRMIDAQIERVDYPVTQDITFKPVLKPEPQLEEKPIAKNKPTRRRTRK